MRQGEGLRVDVGMKDGYQACTVTLCPELKDGERIEVQAQLLDGVVESATAFRFHAATWNK